jgi:hypothetical protein
MNVEIGTETPIFLFWEYFFQNFGFLSLQCGISRRSKMTNADVMYYMDDICGLVIVKWRLKYRSHVSLQAGTIVKVIDIGFIFENIES